MSMEIFENAMRRFAIYEDIELSEQQIENGQIKDARSALAEMSRPHNIY